MIEGILVGLIASVLYPLANLLVFRVASGRRPLVTMTLCMLVFLPLIWLGYPVVASGLGPVAAGMGGISPAALVALFGGVVFFVLCGCYFQFYALIEFSITFRMLVHLLEAPGGAMSLRDLEAVYPFSEVIDRKTRLAGGGGLLRVQEENGNRVLLNSPLGSRLGFFFDRVKKAYRWGDGG